MISLNDTFLLPCVLHIGVLADPTHACVIGKSCITSLRQRQRHRFDALQLQEKLLTEHELPDNPHHYWNDPQVAADLRSRQSGVTDFAKEVDAKIPHHSRILELGCSAGDDAGFFGKQGHEVIALDVSAPLIEVASQRYADLPNVTFHQADVRQSFPLGGQSVDCVFARLSLHYFSHAVTLNIFGEIAWVLRPGGMFFFACRSTEDPLYGRGEQIEPDMFSLNNHVRHFFSPDYARELLEVSGFTKIEISAGKQQLYGEHAAYVKAEAIAP